MEMALQGMARRAGGRGGGGGRAPSCGAFGEASGGACRAPSDGGAAAAGPAPGPAAFEAADGLPAAAASPAAAESGFGFGLPAAGRLVPARSLPDAADSAIGPAAVAAASFPGLACRAFRSMIGGFTGPDLRSAMPRVLAGGVDHDWLWSRAYDKASPIIASSL